MRGALACVRGAWGGSLRAWGEHGGVSLSPMRSVEHRFDGGLCGVLQQVGHSPPAHTGHGLMCMRVAMQLQPGRMQGQGCSREMGSPHRSKPLGSGATAAGIAAIAIAAVAIAGVHSGRAAAGACCVRLRRRLGCACGCACGCRGVSCSAAAAGLAPVAEGGVHPATGGLYPAGKLRSKSAWVASKARSTPIATPSRT